VVESGAGKENKPEVLQNTEGGLERPRGVFFISFEAERRKKHDLSYFFQRKPISFKAERRKKHDLSYFFRSRTNFGIASDSSRLKLNA